MRSAVSRLKPDVAKRIWALTREGTMSTEEILVRLDQYRTYYIHLWEHLLESGNPSDTEMCLTMTKAITCLFEDLRNERGRADVIIERTIMQYPLVLEALEA